MYGSIELGGTKIRCAVLDDLGNIVKEIRIKTGNPEENMKEVVEFLGQNPVKSIGIGAFGPIDVDKESKTYGYVLETPKKLWRNFDLLGSIKKEIDLPMGFTTDVGASGIGEYEYGAAKDKRSSVYITIGTGVGGSYIQDGVLLQGFSHPEMGHIEIAREKDDEVESFCDFHDSCFEGLCAGPALELRAGDRGENLDKDDPAFDILAKYIAKGLMSITMILRPNIIIIGGGVANKEGMIEKIRREFDKLDNKYIDIPRADDYIVFPELGNEAGLIGGYVLAKGALKEASN
ncbi:ROK family protein [Anaerococcus tetradius]|uniref:fructokinase n=1 Tax=Anaerococcus tetradius TaxID=33036 RepID=A0A133KCM6_9FIRM|nr:ROK family protein [Anaerococcus tetradius]KWZ77289.1 putative fructokinase [Anaerococcus tetradius]